MMSPRAAYVADEVCSVCHAEWPPVLIPGAIPLRPPGVLHESDCPTVPQLSPQQRRDLSARLRENDRARRHALANARNVVVGGTHA